MTTQVTLINLQYFLLSEYPLRGSLILVSPDGVLTCNRLECRDATVFSRFVATAEQEIGINIAHIVVIFDEVRAVEIVEHGVSGHIAARPTRLRVLVTSGYILEMELRLPVSGVFPPYA
jgi:hypothetical protein